ncbi:MAG: FkbM family methyltransferase [Gemmataceae bacterium]|nr:FkbM family methyltransferase [Gemmataceae bacterium]
MQSLPISAGKRMAEAFKAGCRFLCRPFVSMLPDALANRLPFLGRVCVHGPDGLRLRFHTYGPHGKDRIAVKLARRGLLGYEGETIRLFLALVKETRTVIDIGANTGLFALLAAAAEPTCRVWAFEPVPFIFDMLQKNIQLNKLENLEAVSCAVSDFVGESTFFITRTNVGIPTDSSSCQGFRDQVEEFPLPTITLDEYMSQQGIDRLELLKIDAEATESKVICGAMQTIRRDRPFIICEVLENIDHSYLQQTLPAMGYQFFHITPELLVCHTRLQGSVNVEQRNYLFVPTEKVTALKEVCAKAGIAIRQEGQDRQERLSA